MWSGVAVGKAESKGEYKLLTEALLGGKGVRRVERSQLGSLAIQRWELCEGTITFRLRAIPGAPASRQPAVHVVSQSFDFLLGKKLAMGVTESGRLLSFLGLGCFVNGLQCAAAGFSPKEI